MTRAAYLPLGVVLALGLAGCGEDSAQPKVDALTNPVAQCRVALEFSSNPQFGGFIVDNGGFVQ